ncbi:MAG: hypothetical protein KDD55_03730, partial [Bdellovibrionales bacterium]|nr:hypothetical protein [Bdellovibrionales bacterium]
GGLIHLNSGSEISDLTVMHTPGSDFGVTLVVEGGSQSDLEDPTTFHTTVRDCNIITDGSTASDSQGVLINGSSVQILSSNISVRSGGSSSHGINFIGGINSRLRLLDSTIYAEGTPQGIGIDVLALGVKATLKGVDIYGSTVSINDALGLIAEIKNSTLRSIANGIVSTGPTSQIRLFYTAFEAADHVLFLPPADVTCAFASNVTTGQSYTSTCE